MVLNSTIRTWHSMARRRSTTSSWLSIFTPRCSMPPTGTWAPGKPKPCFSSSWLLLSVTLKCRCRRKVKRRPDHHDENKRTIDGAFRKILLFRQTCPRRESHREGSRLRDFDHPHLHNVLSDPAGGSQLVQKSLYHQQTTL